jgi:hypothetical protein
MCGFSVDRSDERRPRSGAIIWSHQIHDPFVSLLRPESRRLLHLLAQCPASYQPDNQRSFKNQDLAVDPSDMCRNYSISGRYPSQETSRERGDLNSQQRVRTLCEVFNFVRTTTRPPQSRNGWLGRVSALVPAFHRLAWSIRNPGTV